MSLAGRASAEQHGSAHPLWLLAGLHSPTVGSNQYPSWYARVTLPCFSARTTSACTEATQRLQLLMSPSQLQGTDAIQSAHVRRCGAVAATLPSAPAGSHLLLAQRRVGPRPAAIHRHHLSSVALLALLAGAGDQPRPGRTCVGHAGPGDVLAGTTAGWALHGQGRGRRVALRSTIAAGRMVR